MDNFDEKKWFIYLVNHHEGPFALSEVQSKFTQGVISSETYVWCPTMPDWKVMRDVPELTFIFKPVAVPDPVPPPFKTSNEPERLQVEPPEEEAFKLDGPSEPEPLLEFISPLGESSDLGTVSVALEIIEPEPESAPAPAPDPVPEPEMPEPHSGVVEPLVVIAEPVDLESKGLEVPVIEQGTESIPVPTLESANQDEPNEVNFEVPIETLTEIPQPPADDTNKPGLKGFLVKLKKIQLADWKMSLNKRWVLPVLLIFFGAILMNLGLKLSNPGLLGFKEVARPYLLIAAEKLVFLKAWVSPLPPLDDVTPEDFEELKFAARDSMEQVGPRFGIATSQLNQGFPNFYVSSNVSDGTQLHLYIVGIPETLINELSVGAQLSTIIQARMGKTNAIQLTDGKPIPKGEYIIYLVASEAQTAGVKEALAKIQPIPIKLPPELPKDLRVLAFKKAFLGGSKDANYVADLKEFHTQLLVKAINELAEIKQYLATLESQFQSSQGKFILLRRGAVTYAKRKQWETFHNSWMKLESQLDQIFITWTPDTLAKKVFYGTLYRMTYQLAQEVERTHGFHHAYFNGVKNSGAHLTQMEKADRSAQNAIQALKNKIQQAEKLPPTANGMPRRDGI